MEDFDELLRIQRQMAGRIIEESNEDNKLKMMDVFNAVIKNKNRCQTETVIFEASNEGIQPDDAVALIEELIDLGFLKSPEDGFLERG